MPRASGIAVCAVLLGSLSACGHGNAPARGSAVASGASKSSADSGSPSGEAPPPEHAKLDIVRMVDDVEVFDATAHDLPVGGTLLQETAPVGSTKQEVPKDVIAKVCVAPVKCEKEGDKTLVELPLGATHSYLRVVTQPGESIAGTGQRAEQYLRTIHVPDGSRFALGKVVEIDAETKVGHAIAVRSYLVRGESAVSEKDVVDALAKTSGPAMIQLKLSPDATSRFAALTRESTKRRLAIIVDGFVVTAPVVEQPIPRGELAISLSAAEKATDEDVAEATRLAKALRPPH